MHNTRMINDDLVFIGANDRRLAMFEGVYSVPDGVSYNSYLLKDEKTVVFDTVDKAVKERFSENLIYALDGRSLDYLVVQHMEPDHSAAIVHLLTLFPSMTVVCNTRTLEFIKQFYNVDIDSRVLIVKEGDTLTTGKHTLHFLMAPMVHWPEVMVTYDSYDKILFSADAFGCFGALNGSLYADEVDFNHDYMDEARRYYTNIVGKYGMQVEAVLKKAASVEIDMICPLHGFVWRKNINDILSKYIQWSGYIPEEQGVVIAYASVYGNTENAAEILASTLRIKGITVRMYDTSVIPSSEIIAACFRYSHLVFASTTYNMGIFVTMEALINEIIAHNIQNRTVAFIENGSWAATSGKLMREAFAKCKNLIILEETVSLKSSVKDQQMDEIASLAEAIAADFHIPSTTVIDKKAIDVMTMFKLTYGLFVLSAKDGNRDIGCIVNTVTQITERPLRITVVVNRMNYTNQVIHRTKVFNISVLDEAVPFSIFERFGFSSGREVDKFEGYEEAFTSNEVRYLAKYSNAVISANVIDILEYDTHTVFVAEVTETKQLENIPSVSYKYYFDNIKPKKQQEKKQGYICSICGYIYEGETLPDDFICPICKHGVDAFTKIL